MIRVYLDTSIYHRPFDDQTQPKIFLETQAVGIILQMLEAKMVELVSSSVLEYENSRNPYPIKQEAMNHYLQLAGARQIIDEAIQQRAEQLEHNGFKAVDALHVACAEALSSNYFITCDKRLINRCSGLTLKVVNPVDFVLEINSDNQNEQQVLHEGLRVLLANMEPSKVARFWAACHLGSGDYLKLKDELFEQESVASLYSKVLEFQESKREV